ncbi:DUF4845 domain-containing protein [Pseudothauera nasutitermitis]|uniref:DUF4845 domain-containing protein n=1 Tax=Pseudothauera nasutitermitis TaxID=2565930 RepID=A0A4S4B4G5_9RHOO|nr:DUF4845 domain-containing protein [Pseudothauera nasutitermitis]THF67181.1 DUF4845 domain-containing protein [Pseudothauera nasutitermitis]
MKRKQAGLSLISVLILGAVLAFLLLLGFRTVPAVTEYYAIQRILPQLASEGDNGSSITEIRRSFERRAQIDDIRSVTGTDLRIAKQGGRTVIDVAYSRVVPVAGNVSLLLDFNASSAKR